MLKLLAFVLPLGLDSFAVAAAIGAVQETTAWQRLRLSLVFVIFEGGMPLIGLGLGSALARGIGYVADYLAAAAVIGIGAWMLLAGDKDEEDKASRLTSSHGLALVALGISISLDELAIGFSIGLAGLPVTEVIAAIALQAFLAAQLGLALGARIGERWRERAEQAAGIALILLGGFLLIEQLVRLSPQDRRANAPARMLGQVPGPPHVRCGCLAVCRVRWMLMPDGLGLMLGCGAS